MAVETPAVNMDKLMAFLGQVIGELGATVNAGLIVIGDRLGLYKAMAGAGPINSAELAEKTRTNERYVREWLNAQAAGGFVSYDPTTQRFELLPEQAMALADEDSPAFVGGAFELATATLLATPHIQEVFQSGAGFGWHEHDLGVSTAPATTPTSCRHGCPRSTASRRSCAWARPWPTWAAGWAPRRG